MWGLGPAGWGEAARGRLPIGILAVSEQTPPSSTAPLLPPQWSAQHLYLGGNQRDPIKPVLEPTYPSVTPLPCPVPGGSRSCQDFGHQSTGAGHFLILVPSPLTPGPLHCCGRPGMLCWATQGLVSVVKLLWSPRPPVLPWPLASLLIVSHNHRSVPGITAEGEGRRMWEAMNGFHEFLSHQRPEQYLFGVPIRTQMTPGQDL